MNNLNETTTFAAGASARATAPARKLKLPGALLFSASAIIASALAAPVAVLPLCAEETSTVTIGASSAEKWVEASVLANQFRPTETADQERVVFESELRTFLKNKKDRLRVLLVIPQFIEREKAPEVSGENTGDAYEEIEREDLIDDSAFAKRDQYRLRFYQKFEEALREQKFNGESIKVEVLNLPAGKAYEDYMKGKKADLVFRFLRDVGFEPKRVSATTFRDANGKIGGVQDTDRSLNLWYAKLRVSVEILHADASTEHGGLIVLNKFAEEGPKKVFHVNYATSQFRWPYSGAKERNYLTWRLPKTAYVAPLFAERIAKELRNANGPKNTVEE